MEVAKSIPIKRNISYIYAASFLIAILSAIVSISNFLYRDLVYPTEELLQAFIPNDIIVLFIGLPILLGSMWATRKKRLLGLLFWTGALFFGLYNSIAYIFALPFSWGFFMHLTLLVLGIYTLAALIANIDGGIVKKRLYGAVHERTSGGIVAGFGIFFLIRVFIVIGGALVQGEALTETELAPNISDLFIGPAFVVVGVALWKKNVLGYVCGLGLLFQASMLFIGLIIFLLLQPLLTTASFVATDVIVVSLMSLICFVPFTLFVRGVRGVTLKID